MNNKNFQTFFDCGFSKVRAGVFNKNDLNEAFYAESKFFTDHANLDLEIKKIIASFEKDTNELVSFGTRHTLSDTISISISRKLDGSKLRKTNVQFLIQEAKQQILKHYPNDSIVHIIINNYRIDDVDYSYLPDEIKCNFISLDILFICLPINLFPTLKIFFQSLIFLLIKLFVLVMQSLSIIKRI